MRIKICGITRDEDAQAACELGADALGFIFHPPSPRYIEPAEAGAIIKKLPAFVTTVGVFVDLEPDSVRRIAAETGLDRVQLSGSESAEYCQSLDLKWIKAFRIRKPEDIELLSSYGTGRDYLLDSYVEGLHGGTGKRFNWEWAKEAKKFGNIILAGGLGANNVAEAVRTAHPHGVDVSTLVEKSPGVKDRAKMAAFVEAVRSQEQEKTK